MTDGPGNTDVAVSATEDGDVSESVTRRRRRPELRHLASLAFALLIGLGLARAAHTSSHAVLGAVAVAQVLLILSWTFGTGLPGRLGAIILGLATAAGADAVVTRWPHGELGTLIAVLALAVPAMFFHQLARGASRARVVESLSDSALLLVAVTALATLPQLRHEVDGQVMATAVALAVTAALAAGHLIDFIWSRPRFDAAVSRGVPAVMVSVGAGAYAAIYGLRHASEFSRQAALLLGCSLAAVTALFAVGASYIEQNTGGEVTGVARILQPLFGTLLCLAFSFPVAYLLCLAIRG